MISSSNHKYFHFSCLFLLCSSMNINLYIIVTYNYFILFKILSYKFILKLLASFPNYHF